MTDTIIFGIGSPSDNEQFQRRYKSLGDKSIESYLAGKGIRHTKEPILVSCHRTLERVVEYARDVEEYSRENRTVVVLFGGLSFALPGIFASHAATVPIIGVPAHSTTHGGGLDSSTAVYNLPPGTVVGGAPVHYDNPTSLDKAVLIAEYILKPERKDVTLIAPHESSKHTAEAKKILNPPDLRDIHNSRIEGIFFIQYTHQKALKASDRFGITLNITDSNSDIGLCDSRSMLSLQCRMAKQHKYRRSEYNDFAITLAALEKTDKTIYFSSPQNAALFLARALALHSCEIRQSLLEYWKNAAEEIRKKYGTAVNITEILK